MGRLLHMQGQNEAEQEKAGGIGQPHAPDDSDTQQVIRAKADTRHKVQGDRQHTQNKGQTPSQQADPGEGFARNKLPGPHRAGHHQGQCLTSTFGRG